MTALADWVYQQLLATMEPEEPEDLAYDTARDQDDE